MKKTIRKAFRFRINVNEDLNHRLSGYAGACRFLWNKALALNLFRLENKEKILWYQELSFWTTLWKKSEEYGFLKETPSQALQQKLRDLDKAFKDAFDKKQSLKRIPKFKRKGISDSFRLPQGFKIKEDTNRIFLPKIGWINYRKSRKIEGTPKNITVSRKGRHWYISIQTEYEKEIKEHPSKSMIGIDMGIKRFATLSDGLFSKPLNSFKKLSKKLAKHQRRLAKKIKFSANWKKQKRKISSIHEDIAHARYDYLHQLSTKICKSHAIVAIEDLKVKSMSKSAKGDKTNPGKNVKAKSGLNRSILDQGWGLFVSMLEYKLSWSGGSLLKVPPNYTSQRCPSCKHTSKNNRLSQAKFACEKCRYENHADLVGALNILARGHRVLACGVGSLDPTMKQELAGNSDINLLASCS